MTVCFGEQAVDVAAVVESRGSTQPGLHFTFRPAEGNPPQVTVRSNGTMDFRRVNGPIRLTLTLRDADPNRVFFYGPGVHVFGYSARGAYDDIRPVGEGNEYVAVEPPTDDGRTVSICYRNRSEVRIRSTGSETSNVRYTLYLGDRGSSTYLPIWIDPIISNGGQPMRSY